MLPAADGCSTNDAPSPGLAHQSSHRFLPCADGSETNGQSVKRWGIMALDYIDYGAVWAKVCNETLVAEFRVG